MSSSQRVVGWCCAIFNWPKLMWWMHLFRVFLRLWCAPCMALVDTKHHYLWLRIIILLFIAPQLGAPFSISPAIFIFKCHVYGKFQYVFSTAAVPHQVIYCRILSDLLVMHSWIRLINTHTHSHSQRSSSEKKKTLKLHVNACKRECWQHIRWPKWMVIWLDSLLVCHWSLHYGITIINVSRAFYRKRVHTRNPFKNKIWFRPPNNVHLQIFCRVARAHSPLGSHEQQRKCQHWVSHRLSNCVPLAAIESRA